MSVDLKDFFWHRLLKRPYRLRVHHDAGSGMPVVLLHGLASSHKNWVHTVPHVAHPCRLIVPDLLGFGDSPKPEWRNYSVEDHAKEVIATLVRMGIRRNAVLVGHSMGCLVAVEIARQRPRLVNSLILCGMPLYMTTAQEKKLTRGSGTYLNIYNQIIKRQEFSLRTAALVQRLLPKVVGFSLDRGTWGAFTKSLQHTIMNQNTFYDIQHLDLPITLLCGRYDVFVMKRYLRRLAQSKPNIALQFVNEPHEVTPGYGRLIASAIDAALERAAKPSRRQP